MITQSTFRNESAFLCTDDTRSESSKIGSGDFSSLGSTICGALSNVSNWAYDYIEHKLYQSEVTNRTYYLNSTVSNGHCIPLWLVKPDDGTMINFTWNGTSGQLFLKGSLSIQIDDLVRLYYSKCVDNESL